MLCQSQVLTKVFRLFFFCTLRLVFFFYLSFSLFYFCLLWIIVDVVHWRIHTVWMLEIFFLSPCYLSISLHWTNWNMFRFFTLVLSVDYLMRLLYDVWVFLFFILRRRDVVPHWCIACNALSMRINLYSCHSAQFHSSLVYIACIIFMRLALCSLYVPCHLRIMRVKIVAIHYNHRIRKWKSYVCIWN